MSRPPTYGGDVSLSSQTQRPDEINVDSAKYMAMSRGVEGDVSAGVCTPANSSMSNEHSPARTPAELAREKKLRDDPLALVHSPLYVSCRRCGSRIKLSPKSTYDPFHWQKHRERCLRKPVAGGKSNRVPKQLKSSAKEKIRKLKHKSSSSSSLTPPLTPDNDSNGSSYHIKEESRSPSPTSTQKPRLAMKQPDFAFEDYLFRSRRKTPRDTSPSGDGWHSWSWDQLRAPVWVVASYPDPDNGQDNDDDDDDMIVTTGDESSIQSGHLTSVHPEQDSSLRPARQISVNT